MRAGSFDLPFHRSYENRKSVYSTLVNIDERLDRRKDMAKDPQPRDGDIDSSDDRSGEGKCK